MMRLACWARRRALALQFFCRACCLVTAAGAAIAADKPLPTIVSTNMCADQMVLGLAAPEQILSLSYKSKDPQMSLLAEQARRFPTNYASAEEILQLNPDLVVASRSWSGSRHGQLLQERGIRVLVLSYPNTLAGILHNTETLAAALGRDEAGAALLADIEQRVAALGRQRRDFSVLYLRPNGGSAGRDTYVDTVLQLLGLTNLPASAGISGWGRYPLEYLVQQPPDLFLLSYFDREQPLSKALYSRHPALQAQLQQRPQIRLPGSYWGCGSWHLVEAAELIAEQIAQLDLSAGEQL